MDVYEAIANRKTIREFEDREIPFNVLRRILGAGLQAPTNDHLRRWEFIIVQDPTQRKELVDLIDAPTTEAGAAEIVNRWGLVEPSQREVYIRAIPLQHAMILQAGTLILPCFYSSGPLLRPESLSALNCLASIWCCIENILIAAAAEGVFGVTRIPMEKERQGFPRILHLPDGYEIPCYLALGYPKKGSKRARQYEVRLDEKIHFNVW